MYERKSNRTELHALTPSQTTIGTLMAALSILVYAAPARAGFEYQDFGSTADLALVGDASGVDNRLRINDSQGWLVGAAWHTTKQTVAAGFSTTFDFQINELGSDPDVSPNGADGFALVIQNDALDAIGGAGSAGYGDIYSSEVGIPNSIAVEFDTFYNWTTGDPNGNHVSVHSRGMLNNDIDEQYSLGCGTAGVLMKSGQVHHVRIDYMPGRLDVFVSNMDMPVATAFVDLSSLLELDQGDAWLGFTGGTGAAWENHYILNWSYTAIPEPATLTLLAVGALAATGRRRRKRGSEPENADQIRTAPIQCLPPR